MYIEMGMGGYMENGHRIESLEVYEADFQAPLLSDSRKYYATRAASWLAADTVPAYLAKVEAILVAEADRVHALMHAHTEDKLLSVDQIVLLGDLQARILDSPSSGLCVMLREGKREDLARLYRLSSRLPGALEPIARIVREHFQDLGLAIVKQREALAIAAAAAAAAGGSGGVGASASGSSSGSAGGAVKEEPGDPAFVTALLDLHDMARGLVSREFGGSSIFQKALKDAFEVFINKEVPASKFTNAEQIAGYCDRVLRAQGGGGGGPAGAGPASGSSSAAGKGPAATSSASSSSAAAAATERLSDDAIELALERVVGIFSYIADKDVFGDLYRGQLAKRALQGRSASADMERSMISKLKLRCGAQYTSKMEGMLNDLATASEGAGDFKRAMAAMGAANPLPAGTDFAVQVLTTGWWPAFPSADIRLPAQLEACQAAFRDYYCSRFQHKKLTWIHSQGNASLRGVFTKNGAAPTNANIYELGVTTLQAVALLLFNVRTGPLGFDEIKSSLACDVEVLKRVLHSLSCGKYKVLVKAPESNSIGLTDTFAFNESFASPLKKIRIPMASLDEPRNQQRIEDDRSHTIEAAIVRIMKARKTMTHGSLFSEVIAQLHFFRPNPKVIKKRIEHLIEREYLERDAADPNIYKYLA